MDAKNTSYTELFVVDFGSREPDPRGQDEMISVGITEDGELIEIVSTMFTQGAYWGSRNHIRVISKEKYLSNLSAARRTGNLESILKGGRYTLEYLEGLAK